MSHVALHMLVELINHLFQIVTAQHFAKWQFLFLEDADILARFLNSLGLCGFINIIRVI